MKTTEQIADIGTPGEMSAEAETPGGILRRVRLEAGLRKADVARQLHMTVGKIKALEKDQYDQFKGEVFVKGSLRSYAKLIGVDCEALLHTYDCFVRANRDASDLLEPVVSPGKPVKRANHLSGKWVGVGLGLVVVLLWFLQPADRVELPAPAGQFSADGPVEIDIRDSSIIEALSGESDGPRQDPVVAAVSDIEGNSAEDLLNLSFRGDCWVEERDRDGEVIFASMRHAGDTLELAGRAPFKVLLGYAPVVSMNYNGESVNINSNSRTNSARLVVGST